MTSSVRSHSLLEQKKLQWAKEREEMLGLCGIWGSFARSYHDSDRSSIRSQYLSSIDLNHHVDTSPDASDASGEDRDSHSTSTMKFSLRRSPSLPPIFSPEKQSSCYGNEGDAEGEDETGDGEEGGTSGYASDSGGGNEYHVTQSWGGVIHRNPASTNQWQPHNNFRRQASPDSVTCLEMGRPRWGDKGVGVGHLWAPTTHNPDARLPQVSDRPGPTPPAWLHRRLNKLGEPAQILVISHRDDASTRSKDFTGSCDSINSSECTKTTYIRGQNIPLEPEELAEREIKRRKALEHQNAIRQQLEERERKRKEEKEKRMQEERRAEERLKKQQEMERKRLEDEQRRQKEKEEKEERKAQAMREALENAERAAREDKIRERRRHAAERQATSDLDESMRRVQLNEQQHNNESTSSGSSSSEQQFLNQQQQQQQQYTNQQQQFLIPQQQQQQQYASQQQQHQLNNNGSDAISVLSDPQKSHNLVSDDERPIAAIKAAAIVAPIPAPPMVGNDNDQSEHESEETSSVSTSIGIVLSPQEISANQLSVIPSPGRLLTPSKFRTRQRAVEKATQTFLNKSERSQKFALRYSRGQQQGPGPRLEDRHKWGVNRPEMQYIKQSDRDPYRLRRVVNTRLRARNTSQETSRSPSPGKHSVFNSSNHSETSLNKSINSNSPSITGVSVSRGTTTPRLQVIQKVGSIRKTSAGRPRYISVKGAVMHSSHLRQRMLNRVQLQQPKMNLNDENVVNHEKTEIVSVRDVLNQLTSLRQGLSQKQHEWDISRCQTPYSEVSSRS